MELIQKPADALRQEIGKRQIIPWYTTYQEKLPPIKPIENIRFERGGGALINMAGFNKKYPILQLIGLAAFAPAAVPFLIVGWVYKAEITATVGWLEDKWHGK